MPSWNVDTQDGGGMYAGSIHDPLHELTVLLGASFGGPPPLWTRVEQQPPSATEFEAGRSGPDVSMAAWLGGLA